MSTPAARIVANGRDITTLLLSKDGRKVLVSLTVIDEAGLASDSAELVVDNREGFAVPPIGSLLEIWLGYEPAPVRTGRYRLTGWEKSGPPNTLTLFATAAELTTAIKGQKMRSWHDTTLGAIINKIAGEHSLGVAIDAELAARTVEHIDQQTESDLNFLSRLAKRNGATFKLADGKIVFTIRGAMSFSGRAKAVRTIRPVEVSSWRMREDERSGHKSVICSWMDHKAGKRKTATAGSGEPVHRDKRLYRTEAEAKAAAEAALGDLRRGKREGTFEMAGAPDLFAETIVRLAGFDADVDGDYTAKTVTHSFSSSGYTTSVTLEARGEHDDEVGSRRPTED